MFKRISTSLIAIISMFAMVTPAFALAHGNDFEKNDHGVQFSTQARINDNSTVNEFGVRVFDWNKQGKVNDNNKDKGGDHDNRGVQGDRDDHNGGIFSNIFYTGSVTAVSSSGLTITTKDNQTFTVTAGSAKIVRIPRTVIALSDIVVGDRVNVIGTKSETTITASVVFDFSPTLKPATAKGAVTAVNGNNLTVQVPGASLPVAVKIDGDTKVVNADHTPATTADIETGMTVKLIGFWDSVLNVFNAIKIKLF